MYLSLLAPLVAACDDECEVPSVVRRVANGAFNEDGTSVVLAESRYETCDPEEPFFSTTKGRNFEIILHEAPAADLMALGESPSQAAYLELVDSAREIIRFRDEGDASGIQYDAMHFFLADTRVLGGLYNEMILFDTVSGEMQPLHAPAERLSELVDTPDLPDLSEGLADRQATPAPDGKTIAMFQTASYQLGPFEIYSRHVISLFDAETGAHLESYRVDIDGEEHSEIDPILKPALPGLNYPFRFLWTKDSQGVYVVTRERAIVIDLQGVSSTVDMVPQEPVTAPGGRVADDGRYLIPYLDDTNETRLVITQVPDWIPFQEIPTIPAGTEDYSFSFAPDVLQGQRR